MIINFTKEDVQARIKASVEKIDLDKYFNDTIVFEEDYNCKCLKCGRIVLVGRCCPDRLTQAELDKEIGNE